MKKTNSRKILAITVLLTFLVIPAMAAQKGKGQGMCPGCQGMGQGKETAGYDVATEVTVSGIVEAVTEQTGGKGNTGTHLTLKSNEGPVEVHLGPTTFLTDQGFSLIKGDKIQITGSRVDYEGAPALVARRLTQGNKTLALRDEDGAPQWNRKGMQRDKGRGMGRGRKAAKR